MAIYEINGARYEIDDTNLTKQQLDGAIEEIAAQPQDSAFGYSVDQAEMLGYKGTEAVGSALQGLGFDTVGSALQGFGARGVAQQEEDIARGNFQEQYPGSFFKQDSIGDAAGWILEGMQKNAASGGFYLGGTAAAAVAGLVSAPAAMLVGGATYAGSFLMGTGESALEQEEKTGNYDSTTALGTGALIGFLDRFGAGRVFSPSDLGKMSVKELYEKLAKKGYTEAAQEVAKEIGKKAVTEGVTEATQEAAVIGSAASQGGQYTAGEVGNRLVDAAVLGTSFGGTAATAQTTVRGAAQAAGFAKTSTQRQADTLSNAAATMLERGTDTGDQVMIDKANEASSAIEAAKNGDLAPLKKLAVEEQENNDPSELAKASFAQRLQGIIDDESASDQPFNVENIDVNDAQSARGIVDAAHGSIKEGINHLKAILKEGGTLEDGTSYAGLNPQNAKTFDELMARVEAMVGVNMAKNKVKKTITEKQVGKIKELVGDTQEGQQLVNLIRESVVLTDLHNQGYQGGLSKITDKLNPFAPTGSYNTSALVQASVRAGVTGAAAAGTGGMSLAIQLPIVGFGRLYDALGGDRSTVSAFIRDNKDGDVLPEPTPPSIVEDQAAAQQRREQVSAAMQPLLNQGNKPSGGPVAKVIERAQEQLVGVEVTQDDYDAALDYQIATATTPLQKEVFQDIKERKYRDQMPEDAMAVLTETIVKNKAGEAQAVQTRLRESQEAMIAMEQRNQRNQRIEQGKADNRAAVNQLLDQLNSDNVINKGHKAQLQSALAGTFLRDLGRNPMATVENTIKDLQDNGVPQEAIDTYIMPYAQRVAGQQDAQPVVKKSQAPIDKALAPTFDGKTPTVAGQSTPGTGNKHQLAPHLRIEVAPQREGKPLFTQKTNNKNADVQIDAIDEVLARHPDATSSPEAWGYMMADALAEGDVPAAPYKLIKDLNDGTSASLIGSLTPGQIADADHGFDNARFFREMYTSGQVPIEATGKLFLWSFLSRGVSPYVQEGMFLDSYTGIEPYIEAAADGTLKQKLPAFEKWAKTAAPKGSGQPGAGSTHNLNAFGKTFLIKMSQDAGMGDGRSRLQVIHDMMSDPNTTGQQVRRQFLRMGEGVGIDNKVVSFTLLVAGYDDVMVIDRVQLRNMWNDGRFEGINLWDGYKVDGKPVTGSELSKITYGARGLLVYEAAERAIEARIDDIYAAAGRPGVGSVGRYHWETWVASSQQEASHATIDAILEDIKGSSEPILGVTSKEGEYGSYAYGAQYGVEDGGSYFLYSVPGQGTYKFSVDNFVTFLNEIKKPRNGVVPRLFKVTESGNAPWFTREGVSIDALNEEATKYGRRIENEGDERDVSATSTSQDVPDRSSTNQRNAAGILSVKRSQSPSEPTPQEAQASGLVVPTARQVQYKHPLGEALFEIGKEGSPYENGLTSAEDAARLGEALGISYSLVKTAAEMERFTGAKALSGTYGQLSIGVGRPARGASYAVGYPINRANSSMKPSSRSEAIAHAAHEVAHVLEMTDMEYSPGSTRATTGGDGYVTTTYANPLVPGKGAEIVKGSFTYELMRAVTESVNSVDIGVDKERGKIILAEIKQLQDFGSVNTLEGLEMVRDPVGASVEANVDRQLKRWDDFKAANPGESMIADRKSWGEMAKADAEQMRDEYYRLPDEFAVDPLWAYLVDPKGMKENLPETARFIRDTLNNSSFSNKAVKFYSMPLANLVAVALAVLAANGGEEPEEQPLPSGALSPQGQGALSVI